LKDPRFYPGFAERAIRPLSARSKPLQIGTSQVARTSRTSDFLASPCDLSNADLSDPDAFALSWHILMKGSIVQAAEGDRDAA
jgi:hypothetical protein